MYTRKIYILTLFKVGTYTSAETVGSVGHFEMSRFYSPKDFVL